MAKENPDRTNQWLKHIEAHNSSRLSRRAYCEKNGIKVTILDYWRQRLGDAKEKVKKNKGGWVAVQIQDETESDVDLRIGKITVTVKPVWKPRSPRLSNSRCGFAELHAAIACEESLE